MHYPHLRCGGNNDWSLQISERDIEGVVTVYGLPMGEYVTVPLVEEGAEIAEALSAAQSIRFAETQSLGFVDFCLDQNDTRNQTNSVELRLGDGLTASSSIALAVTTLIDREVPCAATSNGDSNTSTMTWFRAHFAPEIEIEAEVSYTVSVASDSNIRYARNENNIYDDGQLWEKQITPAPATTTFVRGDATGDGFVDMSDAQMILSYLFGGGAAPNCLDIADANDDGVVDVSDSSAILSFLFGGGAELPAPYPLAGYDTTEDSIGCGDAPAAPTVSDVAFPQHDMLIRLGLTEQAEPEPEPEPEPEAEPEPEPTPEEVGRRAMSALAGTWNANEIYVPGIMERASWPSFIHILEDNNSQNSPFMNGGHTYSEADVHRSRTLNPTRTAWFPEDGYYIMVDPGTTSTDRVYVFSLDASGETFTGHGRSVSNECDATFCTNYAFYPIAGAKRGQELPAVSSDAPQWTASELQRLYQQIKEVRDSMNI